MLRVESSHDIYTEFEEEMILFDDDDPDFNHGIAGLPVPIIVRVAADMSLGSVHSAELQSSRHSLDNVSKGSCGWSTHSEQSSTMVTTDHVLTIEELRFQMKSCFSCGVSWAERHVSLDCSECGGYALERPCPVCEGSCGSLWKRDLTMSHASNRARWEGECLEKHIRPKTSETIAPLPLKHQEQHSRSWKFNNGNDKSTL